MSYGQWRRQKKCNEKGGFSQTELSTNTVAPPTELVTISSAERHEGKDMEQGAANFALVQQQGEKQVHAGKCEMEVLNGFKADITVPNGQLSDNNNGISAPSMADEVNGEPNGSSGQIAASKSRKTRGSAMSLENNKTASSNYLEESVCEPPQRWVKSRNSSDIAEKRNKKSSNGKQRGRSARNKMKPSIDDPNGEVGNQPSAGALWDIFRREDAGKLRDYLVKHSREFKHFKCRPVEQVIHPIHDQCFYLTTEHKRRLNEEYGIEPWTFVQKLGEAVFIPAGCPHQVRNLKSCIKVALDFVSPENVHECVKLTEEFRLLPVKHRVNEDKLEVKKMALHALNQAILDITRYDLNQRLRSESETEDMIVKREIEKPEYQTVMPSTDTSQEDKMTGRRMGQRKLKPNNRFTSAEWVT